MKRSNFVVRCTVVTLYAFAIRALSPSFAEAQLPALGVTVASQPDPRLPVTANEAEHHIDRQRNKKTDDEYNRYRQADFPKDSLVSIIDQSAKRWIQYLAAQAATSPLVTGIQLDGYGTTYVAAGQESQAKTKFEARLRTPGLSVADQAYTYWSAISAFTDYDHPERLPDAEAYMRRLDALAGSRAAYWRFFAHRRIQGTYYALGRGADVARHGELAVACVKDMEFFDRGGWQPTMYGEAGKEFYIQLVEALSGQPNGRARLDAVNAALLAGTVPSRELLAFDAQFAWIANGYAEWLKFIQSITARIGTKGPDIQGNFWVNLTAAGVVNAEVRTISVTAGKITLMEMGSDGCPGCMLGLAGMQRLQRRFPQIQTVFATWAMGAIGNRLVDPIEDAKRLAKQFVERNQITDVPISIWVAKKVPTEDDGTVIENLGPNFAAYPMAIKPTYYVIDGNGIIRHIEIGGIDRDKENQMARTLNFLLKDIK